MNIFNKISPLLPYNFGIIGILCIAAGIGTIIYSIFFEKLNSDIALWLICFGLFCTGYRKEKNENDEEVLLRRYHAFRLSFVMTIVTVLIASTSFIISNEPIIINGLYTLLIMCILFNLFFLVMKIYDKWQKVRIDNK
jgi:hypothetical protein